MATNGLGTGSVKERAIKSARDAGFVGREPSSAMMSPITGFRIGGEQSAFSLLPVNVKAYLSALLGNRNGPLQSDFSSNDLNAIRDAIRASRAQYGNTEVGQFGYGHYQGLPGAPSSQFDPPDKSGGRSLGWLLAQSLTDPRFRAETTLGLASYVTAPNGDVQIRDQYDFGQYPRDYYNAYLQREGPWQVAKDMGGHVLQGRGGEALEAIINMFGPAEGEAQRYNLNLGKIPYTSGGFGTPLPSVPLGTPTR